MKGWAIFKYSREIRYALFVLTIFLIIATIKVYVNNINIDNSIKERVLEQIDYKQRESFEKNFYIPYMSWNYAKFFFSHENNVTFSGENVIKFTQLDQFKSMTWESVWSWTQLTWANIKYWTWSILEKIFKEEEDIINITKPTDSWKHFLTKKYEKFLESIYSNQD